MTQKKPLSERWLERLPADSLLLRLLLESFQEHRFKYMLASAAMVLVAASTALSAWMMGEIIDTLATPEDRRRVFFVAMGVAGIFAFKGIAFYIQAVLMARAGNRIVAQKQMQLYNRLLQQGVAFFNTNESSDLLLKITQSAQAARRAIDTIVTGFIRDLLTLIGLVAVMFYQQPFLSLISLIVGPAALFGLQKILKTVRAVMAQEMAGLGEIMRRAGNLDRCARGQGLRAGDAHGRTHGRGGAAGGEPRQQDGATRGGHDAAAGHHHRRRHRLHRDAERDQHLRATSGHARAVDVFRHGVSDGL